jgi:hypothetical protein
VLTEETMKNIGYNLPTENKDPGHEKILPTLVTLTILEEIQEGTLD